MASSAGAGPPRPRAYAPARPRARAPARPRVPGRANADTKRTERRARTALCARRLMRRHGAVCSLRRAAHRWAGPDGYSTIQVPAAPLPAPRVPRSRRRRACPGPAGAARAPVPLVCRAATPRRAVPGARAPRTSTRATPDLRPGLRPARLVRPPDASDARAARRCHLRGPRRAAGSPGSQPGAGAPEQGRQGCDRCVLHPLARAGRRGARARRAFLVWVCFVPC
jgi:hypothetical protein